MDHCIIITRGIFYYVIFLCDADCKFTSIDTGAYRKCSDSSIFKDFSAYQT